MFSYDPEKRPSLNDLKAHPWMNHAGFDFEATRQDILAKLAQKQAAAQQQVDMP